MSNFADSGSCKGNWSQCWWGRTHDLASLRKGNLIIEPVVLFRAKYLTHFGHLAFICCFTFGDLLMKIFVGIFWNWKSSYVLPLSTIAFKSDVLIAFLTIQYRDWEIKTGWCFGCFFKGLFRNILPFFSRSSFAFASFTRS